MWLNEYEVRDMARRFDPDFYPNLAHGAWVLENLMEWTNRNSDGWPYWTKPSKAAKNLIGLLSDAAAQDRNGTLFDDYQRTFVTRTFGPIKTFLTRNDFGEDDYVAVFGE